MAFRRIVRQQPSRAYRIALRAGIVIAAVLAVCISALLLFVNGERIKKPLEEYLTRTTGVAATIARAEFSPLYPNVIKLTDVRAGGVQAGEIYLEYELLSLLGDRPLHLYDLYLKDLKSKDEAERSRLLKSLAGKPIVIDALRLNSIPIAGERIAAKTANLRLNEAHIDDNFELSFSSGQAQLLDLNIDSLPLKSLRLEFSSAEHGLNIQSLQAELLGGIVNAQQGFFNTETEVLSFRQLNLSRLILKDGLSFASPYKLQARQGSLTDIFFAPNEDLLCQGLSADFRDLNLSDGKLSLKVISGSADEIAVPALKLNLTEAKLSGSLTEDDTGRSISGKLEGSLMQGSLSADFALREYNTYSKSTELTLHDLNLKGNVLEFNSEQYQSLKSALTKLSVRVESVRCDSLRLLSYIPTLPLSVENVSMQASALKYAEGRLSGNSAGLINLEFKNLLYSDLYLKEGIALTTISDDMLTFALPKLSFNSSSLSGAAALSFNQAPSYILVNAPDFNLADLNSNLSPHLFNGHLSFNLDLKAPGPFKAEDFASQLQGSVTVKSDSLLVSRFGLDLINGGPKRTLELTGTELMTGLADADTGLYALNLKAAAGKGKAALRGSFDTPASHVFINYALDLKNLELSGLGTFSSLPGDAKTRLKLTGSLEEPLFTAEALERGMDRPGLFLTTQMQGALETAEQSAIESTESTESSNSPAAEEEAATAAPAAAAPSTADDRETEADNTAVAKAGEQAAEKEDAAADTAQAQEQTEQQEPQANVEPESTQAPPAAPATAASEDKAAAALTSSDEQADAAEPAVPAKEQETAQNAEAATSEAETAEQEPELLHLPENTAEAVPDPAADNTAEKQYDPALEEIF